MVMEKKILKTLNINILSNFENMNKKSRNKKNQDIYQKNNFQIKKI